MSKIKQQSVAEADVNTALGAGRPAPLRNLALLDGLVRRARERAEHLPGIVTFSGPSGFGKSTAAGYVAGKHQAYYIEIRSTWTRRALLEAMLRQMGVEAARNQYKMADQVSEELALSQRPIILDEFDNAVERGLVELVRDIYEQSRAPVLLIGEERLPQKLQKWERFHGRILQWEQAQPANLSDAQALARHYAPGIEIADDLLAHLVAQAAGSARRIVTAVSRIAEVAGGEGLARVDRAAWGERPINTAMPAIRRFGHAA